MTKPTMMRLFVGAVLAPTQQAELMAAQDKLKQNVRRCSLTKPENIHLTLRFLGDVAPGQVAAIKRLLLKQAGGKVASGWTQLDGWGRFSRWEGDLVYAKLAVSAQLHRLVAELEQQLQALGFSPETRAWQPHVTLARRVVWSGVPGEWPHELSSSQQPLQAIHLFHSQFTPRGVTYRSLMSLE